MFPFVLWPRISRRFSDFIYLYRTFVSPSSSFSHYSEPKLTVESFFSNLFGCIAVYHVSSYVFHLNFSYSLAKTKWWPDLTSAPRCIFIFYTKSSFWSAFGCICDLCNCKFFNQDVTKLSCVFPCVRRQCPRQRRYFQDIILQTMCVFFSGVSGVLPYDCRVAVCIANLCMTVNFRTIIFLSMLSPRCFAGPWTRCLPSSLSQHWRFVGLLR